MRGVRPKTQKKFRNKIRDAADASDDRLQDEAKMETGRPEKNPESEFGRTFTELRRMASRIVPPKSDAEIANKK